MDIAACESFLAVFDTGTATAAATQRFVSQPALSRQIHALEKHCRTTLFTRSKSGMRPTHAARQLEPVFRRLVDEVRTAESAVSTFNEVRVPLTVACPTMVAEGVLLPFVAETKTAVANIVERPTISIFESLSRRTADLALAPAMPPPEFASRMIYRIPFTAQVSDTSELAGRNSIDIRDLAGLPVIVPDKSNGTRTEFDRHLTRAHVLFKPLQEVSRAHIGQAMVKAGTGVIVTVDPPKYGLISLALTDGDVPLFAEEWAAWQPDHFAEDSISDFINDLLSWMQDNPLFSGLDFSPSTS
ncbi:LysR family transcriptional regulator [Brevibacterium aurantiacum]|uniref:LysR family transcriptional regulator n=1 Tax=Brevibacterium aurantiacum TaxID=273384 RepID=A0A556CBX1_BREAU|nr:LysR family transcriptional regulator [Brevibacterium aurantiacum]TSI14538.1 LysR family transcriptional regulator [Brevibacterium aurantiacum]